MFRRLWDAYPEEPLVYMCSHNGVTGIVRAEDFDDEVRKMRRQFRNEKRKLTREVRPQVNPVFLFSDNNSRWVQSFRVGMIKELKEILDGCSVEQRVFDLPLLRAPGSTFYGYNGATQEIREICSRVGSSFGPRYFVYRPDEIYAYLHGT